MIYIALSFSSNVIIDLPIISFRVVASATELMSSPQHARGTGWRQGRSPNPAPNPNSRSVRPLAVAQTSRTPQDEVKDEPGSSRMSPSPVARAFGGQVIGSPPSPRRRFGSSSVSAV
jgi:hypothetical protein